MGNNNNFRHTAQPQAQVNVAPAKAGNKVVNKRNCIIVGAAAITFATGVGIYKWCKKKCTKKAEEPASAPAEQATQA